MSNNGPDTNGSQFFITFAKQVSLDGKYTIFGQLTDGFDTLEKIENLEVDKKSRPKEKVVIKSVEIHANPFANE